MGSASGERAATIVVAYSANPSAPASVPLIGYHIAAELAALTDTTIIAHRRDEAAMRAALPEQRLRFVGSARLAGALRRVAGRLFPGKWGLISVLDLPDYLWFDIEAYRACRRELRSRRIDYVLRVNPVSFRFPSLLSRLRTAVFTGPHNGGMRWPPGFAHLDRRDGTASSVRGVGDLLHRLYRDTRRYAGIFAAHEQCAAAVPSRYRPRVQLISENAVAALGTPSRYAGDARRLLYVGRLATFKVVDILVRAIARLPDDVALTVVGEGPERSSLEALTRSLGLTSRVRFTGQLPHDEVFKYYEEAGVFAFPSVRESGGAVVLEAMAHGLPCLVADWGGPRLYTRETGIHLRVDSPQALEDDLVATVLRLLADPEEGRRVGERSRAVIRDEYLWPGKAARLHTHAMSVLRTRH